VPISDEEHDRMLAGAAASVSVMDRKLRDAHRMLTAAAISADRDLLIYDGALSRVDLYETIMQRDEAEGALRIHVRPKR
jgi:hypothetical protein